MRGSDLHHLPPPPQLSFNIRGETDPTQMRGPRDASRSGTRAPTCGPPGHQISAAAEPPPPCPPPTIPLSAPHTHPTRTRVRDSHLLVKEPEPEPTPLRPGSPATASWLFRACQLNPDSARQVCSPGPITQDGDRNKNVETERRITAVGKLQSCDRSETSDPASSSAPTPAPRPPRSAGSPGTEGGCSLSRRQTSPRPRGRARTHTHSHAAAATDTIGRRRTEGQREDTPRVPPGAASAAASGP